MVEEQTSGRPAATLLWLGLDRQLNELSGRVRSLARAAEQLEHLLEAVVAISRETDLHAVLRRVVLAAMELVDARYGALGVLDETGGQLAEFIAEGLTDEERAALAPVGFPRGKGLLGHLIRHPEPLRVDEIASHPSSYGFPPGHPPMRTLLGVAVSSRGTVYGNLYLSERRDGRPFDVADENVLVALAATAGIAIDGARRSQEQRDSAARFQRLLLPDLPDLSPFDVATAYHPAAEPSELGGDWYDAVWLPDDACALVIGDVVGHDMRAAAAMSQTRSMLRALLFDRLAPSSAVLSRLDRTLSAITDCAVTTCCLARIEAARTDSPNPGDWTLRWSNAGHPPPLLITPDENPRYLYGDPGLPLGVDASQPRADHVCVLPPGATVVFYTDGLVERHDRDPDASLGALAEVAGAHRGLPLAEFVRVLVDHHPSDGHDDMAVLAVRTPPGAPGSRGAVNRSAA
jgi:serine phosphatase RsbU (regulator of sigma subunit)